MNWLNKTHVGDCRALMRSMAADGVKVQTCVTSPPYYGLRDYGVAGQIGQEQTLSQWIDAMVEVFDCVRDVLADDGTLWLNLGDSYAQDGGPGWQGRHGYLTDRKYAEARDQVAQRNGTRRPPTGLKPKDLMGQPWRVAFALQDAGWHLRSDIIWHKVNPMPESVKDRPTKSHEYIFLLSKSEHYHYDAEAISEPTSPNTHARMKQKVEDQRGSDRGNAGVRREGRPMKAMAGAFPAAGVNPKASQNNGGESGLRSKQNASMSAAISGNVIERRNSRTVWTMASESFSGAHFATFPRDLPRRCILAGSKVGDAVLDPFMGSGTVGQVATDLARQFIGCELNPDYVALHDLRKTTMGLPL